MPLLGHAGKVLARVRFAKQDERSDQRTRLSQRLRQPCPPPSTEGFVLLLKSARITGSAGPITPARLKRVLAGTRQHATPARRASSPSDRG